MVPICVSYEIGDGCGPGSTVPTSVPTPPNPYTSRSSGAGRLSAPFGVLVRPFRGKRELDGVGVQVAAHRDRDLDRADLPPPTPATPPRPLDAHRTRDHHEPHPGPRGLTVTYPCSRPDALWSPPGCLAIERLATVGAWQPAEKPPQPDDADSIERWALCNIQTRHRRCGRSNGGWRKPTIGGSSAASADTTMALVPSSSHASI